jgi:sulfur-oxidizing protein SoxY
MQRRNFLQGVMNGGVAATLATLFPQAVLADWPKAAFESKDVNGALQALLGATDSQSEQVDVTAPDIAENGAVVPIKVSTKLDKVESITLIAEKNPSPLVASFNYSGDCAGFVSTRIKMGETQNVIVVVKSGGKLYSAQKSVKVTVGGCGG